GREYPLGNGTHSRARGGPDWVAGGVRAGSAGGVAVLATLEGAGRPVVRGHELLARVSGARVVGLFRVGAARSARPDHAPTKLVGRERDAARAPDAGNRPGGSRTVPPTLVPRGRAGGSHPSSDGPG